MLILEKKATNHINNSRIPMPGSFHKTKETIQRIFMKKRVANNKISAHNKAIAPVETIVTLLLYYHRQQFFVFTIQSGIELSISLCLSFPVPSSQILTIVVCNSRFGIDIGRSVVSWIPRSVYNTFSRSFDICRSIENLFCTMNAHAASNKSPVYK